MTEVADRSDTAVQWETLWPEGSDTPEWSHSGIAVLGDGRVVFAHPGGERLVLLDPVDGQVVEEPTDLLEMHGISVDPRDPTQVWIADPAEKPRPAAYWADPELRPGRVVRWRVGYGITRELTQPSHPAYGDAGWRPTSVVAAPDGRIWVADGYGADLIHIYEPDGRLVRTLTGDDTGVAFSCPHGLIVDTRGAHPRIVVADRGNRRLVFLSLDGSVDRTVADEGMDSPSCLAIRGRDLLVTELNGGLLAVDPADSVSILVGKPLGPLRPGWPNALDEAGVEHRPPLHDGRLNSPHGIAVDTHDRIYLTEWLIGGRHLRLTVEDAELGSVRHEQDGDTMVDMATPVRREIRGYDAVRAAARDYETYSSDLLGERDIRTYRQLPLESDPPRHTQFRSALQPIFMGSAIEPKSPQFEKLALDLISRISERGGGEIANDLALPFVVGCLTIIYNRPQDFDEWLSWGPDVFDVDAYAASQSPHHSQSSGGHPKSSATLERYLTRVFDDAEANPETDPDRMDVWDTIAQLEVDGARVTRAEMLGMANVLLAGGRDTVIKLLTGITWHLLHTPEDREYLTGNEEAFNRTIAEMARYLSPLPKMERVLPEDRTPDDADRDPSKYVLLSFVSANFDKTVWPDAEVLDIHRERKPHLAFGFGRHSCMGMNITEHETKAFLRTILNNWPDWTLDGEPDIEWVIEGEGEDAVAVINHFRSLRVKVAQQ
jgi:cytochrome P450